jgi:hypothetical protein
MRIENTQDSFEMKKLLSKQLETLSTDVLENDALKRCAQASQEAEPDLQQLYSRMHHRHNRS